MNKIPTAEELVQQGFSNPPFIEIKDLQFKGDKVCELMNNFAKLHVEAALKAASENATVVMVPNCFDHTPFRGPCVTCGRYDNPDVASEVISKKSILNSYPLDNIK